MAKSLEVQDVAHQHETVRLDTGQESKQAIGLEHCKFFLTGAAPISKEVLEYFASIGISINEVLACKRVYPVKRTHNSLHFPPFFRWIDGHGLWHLAAVPAAFLFHLFHVHDLRIYHEEKKAASI